MVMKMDMAKIRVLPSFAACPPRAEKLDRKRAYYEQNGHYDRKLLVDRNGWLVDGYATYLIMKENGESTAESEIASGIWPVAGCADKSGKWDWYGVSMRLAKKLRPGSRVLLFANGALRSLQVRQIELFSGRPCWPAHGFMLPGGGPANV